MVANGQLQALPDSPRWKKPLSTRIEYEAGWSLQPDWAIRGRGGGTKLLLLLLLRKIET